jgi:hypothetical protein
MPLFLSFHTDTSETTRTTTSSKLVCGPAPSLLVIPAYYTEAYESITLSAFLYVRAGMEHLVLSVH